jgi:hypothetical protein
LRILITLVNAAMFGISFYYRGWYVFFFFTVWALCLSIIYLPVSVLATKGSPSMNLLAWHHILFSATFFSNIVVTTIYWPLLHSMYIAREEIATNPIRLACAYGMHAVPILGSIYNFKTIDAVLKASHAKALIPVMVAYLYVNYRATLAAGQTLYWFLSWEDWTTGAVAIFLLAVFLGAYILCARATIFFRPRKSATFRLIDGIFYRIRPRRGSK